MRTRLLTGVLGLCLFGFVACYGSTDDSNSSGSAVAVVPGDPCTSAGATAPSTDGCNSCTCKNGEWSCTTVACSAACNEGDSKPAGDGCNTCTCTGNHWGCTLIACAEDGGNTGTCPAPTEPSPTEKCAALIVYARSPELGTCCSYESVCVSPDGWPTFLSEAECLGQDPGMCVEGDTMPSADGCNTCSCSGGMWACTLRACVEKCLPGETRRAPDGCNTCTCGDDGLWGGCTEIGCDPNTDIACGGWSGDTCTDDEYCAYVEGQICGAADASSTCQLRPEVCTQEYAPVCGCDGMTYSNSCAAAGAGTGVNYSGECAASF